MTTVGQIKIWHEDDAWGVLDSPETPGGCWAHLSHIAQPGPWTITVGQKYFLDWIQTPQDGYEYRAVRMWVVGSKPDAQEIKTESDTYKSSLNLKFSD